MAFSRPISTGVIAYRVRLLTALDCAVRQISTQALDNFLTRLEQGYSKFENPYHNLVRVHLPAGLELACHCQGAPASVLQSSTRQRCITETPPPVTISRLLSYKPYHNLVHAADVTQTTYHLFSQSGLVVSQRRFTRGDRRRDRSRRSIAPTIASCNHSISRLCRAIAVFQMCCILYLVLSRAYIACILYYILMYSMCLQC